MRGGSDDSIRGYVPVLAVLVRIREGERVYRSHVSVRLGVEEQNGGCRGARGVGHGANSR